ncbi:MAG TPA: glutamate--tRNA ligase [Erysipelothrix sp.]|nr:glutamate--tRNA ligase [Erysipelothrix sp.]
MEPKKLAQLLFPNVEKTIEEYEDVYPPRPLAADAKVTRLGPSPTGFIHLGNLYGAFVDERLAHQSGGTMILRIEDTDAKRAVEGAVETVINGLDYFGIQFDEGATLEGEKGAYGPYHQQQRVALYHAAAKRLVELGKAYPSWASEEELADIRARQEAAKVMPGYYGQWAQDRYLSDDDIMANLEAKKPFVLRLKASGKSSLTENFIDGIRGSITVHPNDQDAVLLKADGVPTYHFAHVVDDHYMRITHIIRGEEWLSTLPIHLELFEAFGWQPPIFCHTAHLMKIDEGVRRKLSKRLDPELSLEYYMEVGYFPQAVREYLMILMNSDFEEWRIENPDLPLEDFPFTLDKMSVSGALFDMEKLDYVSKEVLLKIPEQEIMEFLIQWSKNYKPEVTDKLVTHQEALIGLFSIGRTDRQPRKDLLNATQILDFVSYYFDDQFSYMDDLPERVDRQEAVTILNEFLNSFDLTVDGAEWFNNVKAIAEKLGYAVKMKDYRKNPDNYKGSVADVATVIRLAMVGTRQSTDLYSIQKVFGVQKTTERLHQYIKELTP